MNYCNYTFFEVLKYKIEFSNMIEYCLKTETTDKNKVKKNITYLKNNYEKGNYKTIVSSLFTDFNKINIPISLFFKNYNYKTILKAQKSNKADTKIIYIKHLIDCIENLNQIIDSFIEEKEIKEKLNEKILTLKDTSNLHFIYYIYFILYKIYASDILNKNDYITTDKDLIEIVSLIKYCNQDNLFDSSIEALKNSDEIKINKEFEKISSKCLELETKQEKETQEIITLLNANIESK